MCYCYCLQKLFLVNQLDLDLLLIRILFDRNKIERLCQGIPPAKPLLNFTEKIPEAYHSNLDLNVAGSKWPSRAPHSKFSDVYLNDIPPPSNKVIISEVEILKKKLIEIATSGRFRYPNKTTGELNIDLFGDITEASVKSKNPEYYGRAGLHNNVHILIAFMHNPKSNFSVNFF